MRRPQFDTPIVGDKGLALRQWADFFIDIWNVGGLLRQIKVADFTIDFASIATHATVTSNVTVKGARANDIVTIGLPATVDAGVTFDAHVSADDTVTIRATNVTAGPIDPASATYRIMVTMI